MTKVIWSEEAFNDLDSYTLNPVFVETVFDTRQSPSLLDR